MKVIILYLACVVVLFGCATDSQVASHNLSRDAEMFRINRRIIFYNSIRDIYMLSIEGRCSIKADRADNQLEVTCRTGDEAYKKHFLGISDNVTYFVEQLDMAEVNVFRYKVVFKPTSMFPDIETKI